MRIWWQFMVFGSICCRTLINYLILSFHKVFIIYMFIFDKILRFNKVLWRAYFRPPKSNFRPPLEPVFAHDKNQEIKWNYDTKLSKYGLLLIHNMFPKLNFIDVHIFCRTNYKLRFKNPRSFFSDILLILRFSV